MADASQPVELSIWIAARPETVFAFLTEPDRLVQWLGRTATLHPRPSGLFRVDVNGRDAVRGEYLVVEPPHRVVFSFGYEGPDRRVPPGSTRVEITLTPHLEGVVLRLRHTGLPEADRDSHGWGWGHYASRLKSASEGRDPGQDPLGRPEIRHG